MAIAEGNFIQKGNLLEINTEINAFRGMMIPFYVFCFIIYSFFIIGCFTGDGIKDNFEAIGFLFTIIHAVFMMGVPYLIMRGSTKSLKHELEREFYYLTKK
jgi:hypothetical protein